jgi:hypothetical protein
LEQICLRNPKSDDLGDVIADNSSLENQFLYDEKELYLQPLDDTSSFFDFTDSPTTNHSAYHILVREWNP